MRSGFKDPPRPPKQAGASSSRLPDRLSSVSSVSCAMDPGSDASRLPASDSFLKLTRLPKSAGSSSSRLP